MWTACVPLGVSVFIACYKNLLLVGALVLSFMACCRVDGHHADGTLVARVEVSCVCSVDCLCPLCIARVHYVQCGFMLIEVDCLSPMWSTWTACVHGVACGVICFMYTAATLWNLMLLFRLLCGLLVVMVFYANCLGPLSSKCGRICPVAI